MNDEAIMESMSESITMRKETRTNLIINHLPHQLLDKDFHHLFAQMGTVKKYRIMKNLESGVSYGFGFVEYVQPEDAAKAILQLNNYGIQNKRLKVSYAQPPGGDEDKETNLYVQNLPLSYDLDQLHALFSQHGTIVQKLIFKDKNTGLARGIAFVRYSEKNEAEAAIQAIHGLVPEGGIEAISVKIAKDNTKKRSSYQAGYQAGLMRGRGGGQFNDQSGPGFGRGQFNSYGRGQFNNHSGPSFGRGNFSNMSMGLLPDREFGMQHEMGSGADFGPQRGKMGVDRSNNRYNPMRGSMSSFGGNYSLGSQAFNNRELSSYHRLDSGFNEPYGHSRLGGFSGEPSLRGLNSKWWS